MCLLLFYVLKQMANLEKYKNSNLCGLFQNARDFLFMNALATLVYECFQYFPKTRILLYRKGKPTSTHSFGFMTMADRSPTKTALKKKAVSVRDLYDSEYRGVMNTAYATDGGAGEEYKGEGWFMVNNPEFNKPKLDFMSEVS